MRTGSFFGPQGLRLVITTNDADTPGMVYLKRDSATYYCAMGEGYVDTEPLSTEQFRWLAQFDHDVDAAFAAARRDLPQYQ